MQDKCKAAYKFPRCFFAGFVAAIFPGFTTLSNAEVIVTGTASSLELRSNGETVGEALRTLSTTFNLKYHTPQALTRRLQKTYKGSLEKVVSEMLCDYDYLTIASADNLEVWIGGLGNTKRLRTQNQALQTKTQSPVEPTNKASDPPDKPEDPRERRHVTDGWHHQ
jgi:hypothetical protein